MLSAFSRRIGYKGLALMMFGMMFVVLGSANIGSPPPSGPARENLSVVLRIMPIEGWYIAWILAGLSAIVAAFSPRIESLAAAVTTSLPLTFSLCYFATSIIGVGFRAWAAGIIYLMIAMLVAVVTIWPDPYRAKYIKISKTKSQQ